MDLPLVGGGEHDWNFLLGVWGVLPKDTLIARDIRSIGTLIVAASIGIGWWALAATQTEANGDIEVQAHEDRNV